MAFFLQEERALMNQICSAPTWPVFKQKLKERYRHLTDADLAAIESDKETWLDNLQRAIGRSSFEIARLAEEVSEEQDIGLNPVWLAFARSEEWRSRHWCGHTAKHD